MEKAKVYFTNLRCENTNLPKKLHKLMKAAGFENIDFENKYAAIKLHFGEPGNMAYLRPNFAREVVEYVKSLGGKAFLTDCNTLYVGGRKNALDHLDSAYQNGYNPFTTNCHIIIADGLKGTDEAEVPVKNGEYVKSAKIGRAVMDADVFISLTHFKGHEAAGFGGVLKNIGMGCGSRAGKQEMHSAGTPAIIDDKCRGCHTCEKNCAHDGIYVGEDHIAHIREDKCVGCGRCIGHCPFDAITTKWDEANEVLNYKIAEYTQAVVQDRPSFHVSFVIDVSPECDCLPTNDAAIIPDIGIFASTDPVALDQACVDAVNATPALSGTIIDECGCGDDHHHHHDYFTAMHPDTCWQAALEHGEKIGLGVREYELITVK